MPAPRSEGAVLTIDRGNSTLDCQLWTAGEPLRHRLDSGDAAGLGAWLARLERSAQRPVAAVGCTVVESGLGTVAALLDRAGIPLALAGRDLPCPLEVRYPDPGTLGVDRWVAAWAAFREVGACVVVDCGTAVTIDLVDGAGVFLGGAIAPGAATMARGLRAAAPALPPAELDRPLRGVPVTSADAVGFGVGVGFCGAVERLVEELAAAGGLADAPRVLTGGGAAAYLRRGRLAFRHVPDLLHRGLHRLWCERGPGA